MIGRTPLARPSTPLIASPLPLNFDRLSATPPPIEESFIEESNAYPIPLKLSPISSRKQDTNSPDLFLPEFKNVGVAG